MIFSDKSINPLSVQFVSLNDTNQTNTLSPLIQSNDNQTFHISYSAVDVQSMGLYQLCFSYVEEGSGDNNEDLETCLGTFNLTIIS